MKAWLMRDPKAPEDGREVDLPFCDALTLPGLRLLQWHAPQQELVAVVDGVPTPVKLANLDFGRARLETRPYRTALAAGGGVHPGHPEASCLPPGPAMGDIGK